MKSGAVRGFDWKSRNREEAEKKFKQLREEQSKAWDKYAKAKDKRTEIEKNIKQIKRKLEKKTKKNNDYPLF